MVRCRCSGVDLDECAAGQPSALTQNPFPTENYSAHTCNNTFSLHTFGNAETASLKHDELSVIKEDAPGWVLPATCSSRGALLVSSNFDDILNLNYW